MNYFLNLFSLLAAFWLSFPLWAVDFWVEDGGGEGGGVGPVLRESPSLWRYP